MMNNLQRCVVCDCSRASSVDEKVQSNLTEVSGGIWNEESVSGFVNVYTRRNSSQVRKVIGK